MTSEQLIMLAIRWEVAAAKREREATASWNPIKVITLRASALTQRHCADTLRKLAGG